MEGTENKLPKKLNGLKIHIIPHNITSLNVSYSKINKIENVKFPLNLIELNISHNSLHTVSETIMYQKHLKTLDISYNAIKYFDDTPSFCDTIESLNISNNNLHGPPAWIWFQQPKNLTKLDISCNKFITDSFQHGYDVELLQHKTKITHVEIHNCRLQNHTWILSTFPKAKNIKAGAESFSYCNANLFSDIPCKGLSDCCDIERLNLSNTHIFNIKPSVEKLRYLIEINLSNNKISCLPEEFCNLKYLEVCILSCNQILYLPNNFLQLKNLVSLSIDSNELCMLPKNLCDLPNLRRLDLYDNYLCELPKNLIELPEIDFAQNYADEPSHKEYKSKQIRLRATITGRYDGRKFEVIRTESIQQSHTSDEEDCDLDWEENLTKDIQNNTDNPPSSPEDWDSDDFWVPYYFLPVRPSQSPWLYFIKRKIEEGNFCPIDAHTVSVCEKVKYEKMCNPQIQYESDGQFDDYSSDDS